MSLLRIRPDGPQWPYSIAQFRADEPHLSISDNPHDGELASYATLTPPIIVARPQLTDPPEHDPATHQAREVTPIEVNGAWRQAWELVPLPPPVPAPDFAQLRQAIRTENGFSPALLTVFQADPVAGSTLGSRLDTFELTGNYALFLQSLQAALAALPAQQAAHIGLEFLALSVRTSMPAPFIQALESLFEDLPGGEGQQG